MISRKQFIEFNESTTLQINSEELKLAYPNPSDLEKLFLMLTISATPLDAEGELSNVLVYACYAHSIFEDGELNEGHFTY